MIKNYKRTLSILLATCAAAALLTGCRGGKAPGITPPWTPSPPLSPEATSTASPEPAQTSTPSPEPGPAYAITYEGAKGLIGSSGYVSVAVLFEITNTGGAPLELLPGKYDLGYSDDNIIVADQPIAAYPQVIAPGEKAYYYDNYLMAGLEEIRDFTVSLHPVIDAAESPPFHLDVSDASVYEGPLDTLQIRGTIKNNTGQTQDGICIAGILFDGQNPLAVLHVNLDKALAAGGILEFDGTDLMNDGIFFEGLPAGVLNDLDAQSYELVAVAYPFS